MINKWQLYELKLVCYTFRWEKWGTLQIALFLLYYNQNLIVNRFPLNNTGEQLDQRVMENNNSEPNTNNIDNI